MKHIFTLFFLLAILQGSKSQTNVSGGIFSNTTWHKINSPYIVTGDIVVFPGITLTIEPGVVVKFDRHFGIEIRQASLITNGTSADSITFTSNDSLVPGYWKGIYLNGGNSTFKFINCSFKYASLAIDCMGGDSLYIRNSNFDHNKLGLQDNSYFNLIEDCNFSYNTSGGASKIFFTTFNNCTFNNNNIGLGDPMQMFGYGNKLNNCVFKHNSKGILDHGGVFTNCTISNNQTGISNDMNSSIFVFNCDIDSNTIAGVSTKLGSDGDSIVNCNIRKNGTGIIDGSGSSLPRFFIKNNIENNLIGIDLTNYGDTFQCNKICNNTTYNLKYNSSMNTGILRYNYWCGDSSATQATIYDAHNNISSGLITFMPMDSSCYLINGVKEYTEYSFSIYPNPASSVISINNAQVTGVWKIEAHDIYGNIVISSTSSVKTAIIDVRNLPEGIYFVSMTSSNKITTKKIVVEH